MDAFEECFSLTAHFHHENNGGRKKIPQLDQQIPLEESENRREEKYFKLTRGIILNCNLSQKHFDTDSAQKELLVHCVSRALQTVFKTTLVRDGISLHILANLV